jgi:hypothetical protein
VSDSWTREAWKAREAQIVPRRWVMGGWVGEGGVGEGGVEGRVVVGELLGEVDSLSVEAGESPLEESAVMWGLG